MADRLTLRTREQLREKIETTLVAIQARAIDLTAEAIAAEVQADAEELMLGSILVGFVGAYGQPMAEVIIADLTNQLAESDAQIARRLGTSQQAVSKVLGRVRRNLGFPPRVPNNATGPLLRAVKKGRRAD